MGNVVLTLAALSMPTQADDSLRAEVRSALTKSMRFFREDVARHGGFQYAYSEDLKRSSGESRRGAETVVTVQPPGTPAVGDRFLDAYEITGDNVHLEGARSAARCLLEGQLRSGGWGYAVEYDPELRPTHAYRVEPEAHDQKNTTVLDDNTTQLTLRFLMRLDKLLGFEDDTLHDAIHYGLDSLVKAQFANGAWPQRYDTFPDPSEHQPRRASFTDDWPRKYPGPKYKKWYTFNDNTIADVIKTLFKAGHTYGEAKYREAAKKGADFILLAQLPEPQPAWAQQYEYNMHPVWARKFEPAAVSGRESMDIMLTLLEIYRETGETKYLDPIPPALAYFRRSVLPDGSIARFYEMTTNQPLFFTKKYELTYSDADLPTHYGFKNPDRTGMIEARYRRLRTFGPRARLEEPQAKEALATAARDVLGKMDAKGRWVVPGKIRRDEPHEPNGVIQTGTFLHYTGRLCAYLRATSSWQRGD
jgi:PelA/Pel-15E family pectate lyase